MKNPFVFNGYGGVETFFDREVELATLMRYSADRTPVALISTRRMGKTGLIRRMFDEIAITNSRLKPIYVDILATRDLSEFNKTLASAILNVFPEETSVGRKLISAFKGLRPLLSFDQLSGAPQLQITYRNDDEKIYTLEGLLAFLNEQPNPVVLAIDEFQQIRAYPETNVEAMLRTQMQQLGNVSFLFSGSKKHMMADIFSNPQRPFYASTQFLSLNAIEEEKYKQYIVNAFESGEKSISDDAVNFILTWTRRHTYFTQLLCHEVYDKNQSAIGKKDVEECCERLLNANEAYFLQYRQLLSPGQWNMLVALAKEEYVSQPYATAFLSRYKLGSSAAAKRQLTSLIEKDVIEEVTSKDSSYYTISDTFFLRWLAREY